MTDAGDHLLRVSVRGPTFARDVIRSVAVRNPLTLEIQPAVDGAVVWAEVNAAGIDSRSLRVAAKVRRPPSPAKLLPADSMPTGLWKIKIPGLRGTVDISLDISGNLLNKKEISIKTEPISIAFPLREGLRFGLDLEGNQIHSAVDTQHGETTPGGPANPAVSGATPPAGAQLPELPAAEDDSELQLPLWFVMVIACVNLLVIGALWWLLKPPGSPSTLPKAVAELVGLLPAAAEPA